MNDSDEEITVFTLELGGSTCCMTLQEMKDTLEVMLDTDDDSEYTLSTKVMTLKEFKELPEFEGY